MRFIIAIGVFVVAAIFLGIGVTQKLFFSGPEMITLSAEVEPNAAYVVIDGKTLTLHGTTPYVTVSGASKGNFVGYGRTSDVKAWIGKDKYEALGYSTNQSKFVLAAGKPLAQDPENPALTELPEQTITSPAGSDLWLGEASAQKAATVPTEVDKSMSVIIASDGTANAPGNVTISWPLPSAVPFATGFIVIGGVLALAGLILYLWALRHDRNSQGPRRRGSGPKPPKPRSLSMPTPKSLVSAAAKGRRGLPRGSSFIALGLAGALAIGLSSCSPFQAPQAPAADSTPSATPTPGIEGEPPAVTERQLGVILEKIANVVSSADSTLDATLSATRLIGPAQEIRAANYAIRKADGGVAALPALASSPITFVMPQATNAWPRQVIAVVQNEKDPSVPTMGLMMIQNSPRDNYHVEYLVTLEPNASVPTVAPANVGSALVMPDSKLLLISPDQLSAAYGSVLMQGEASPYYGLFDLTADSLVTQVGKAYKDQKVGSLSGRASVEFSQSPGTGVPMGLATLDSGAIVTVGLNEVETVKPTEAGASVSLEGQAKTLSGISSSPTGVESTYGLQLAFYVPPLGSTDKIRLLGYTQGLIAARGL